MPLRGGTLEPARKVPPFKYTNSPERQKWISMMYPYMPYLANLFREIPWGTFRYEEDGLLVTDEDIEMPYQIIGGAVCEFLDDEYKSIIPDDKRLHKFCDATGDIDASLTGLTLTLTKERVPSLQPYFNLIKEKGYSENLDDFYEDLEIPVLWATRSSGPNMLPPMKAYIDWLLGHIEAFLKKLSYAFKDWFPDAIFDDPSVLEDEYFVEGTLRSVGPFHIYGIPSFFSRDDIEGGIRLQLSLAYRFEDRSILNHCMEFLPAAMRVNPYDIPPYIKTSKGFFIDSPVRALWYNIYALPDSRDPVVIKIKEKNYAMRTIFLGNFITLPEIYPHIEHSHSEYGHNKALTLAEMYFLMRWYQPTNYTREFARDILRYAPLQFRREDPEKYKQLCAKFMVSDEECTIPESGGYRKTRRTRQTKKRFGSGKSRRLHRRK